MRIIMNDKVLHCNAITRVVIRLKQITAICIFAISLSSLTAVAKDFPGSSETSYGVGNTGAFNFGLPIVIPEGTNGVQPSLNLNFSSGRGSGMLGVGWSLSGLGAITRCSKTFATEGARGGVLHDGNDQFCLNGQKLILASGTHGAANSEYRTEIDVISRVKAIGNNNNNINGGLAPNSWKVWRRDGMIIEYGSTPTASFKLPNSNSIHSWNVAKVSDRNGNYYTVTYHTDDGRPDEINYTKMQLV